MTYLIVILLILVAILFAATNISQSYASAQQAQAAIEAARAAQVASAANLTLTVAVVVLVIFLLAALAVIGYLLFLRFQTAQKPQTGTQNAGQRAMSAPDNTQAMMTMLLLQMMNTMQNQRLQEPPYYQVQTHAQAQLPEMDEENLWPR